MAEITFLKNNGVDVEVMERTFMGRKDMYDKFLRMFLTDATYDSLAASVDSDDWDEKRRFAHTMKGLSSTLGFTKLFEYSKNMQINAEQKDDAAFRSNMKSVTHEYLAVRELLAKYFAE